MHNAAVGLWRLGSGCRAPDDAARFPGHIHTIKHVLYLQDRSSQQPGALSPEVAVFQWQPRLLQRTRLSAALWDLRIDNDVMRATLPKRALCSSCRWSHFLNLQHAAG